MGCHSFLCTVFCWIVTILSISDCNVGQVFLDPKELKNTEYKLESFSAVYRTLSGKDVVFEYPITDA